MLANSFLYLKSTTVSPLKTLIFGLFAISFNSVFDPELNLGLHRYTVLQLLLSSIAAFKAAVESPKTAQFVVEI